jgi:hypothetical protein
MESLSCSVHLRCLGAGRKCLGVPFIAPRDIWVVEASFGSSTPSMTACAPDCPVCTIMCVVQRSPDCWLVDFHLGWALYCPVIHIAVGGDWRGPFSCWSGDTGLSGWLGSVGRILHPAVWCAPDGPVSSTGQSHKTVRCAQTKANFGSSEPNSSDSFWIYLRSSLAFRQTELATKTFD